MPPTPPIATSRRRPPVRPAVGAFAVLATLVAVAGCQPESAVPAPDGMTDAPDATAPVFPAQNRPDVRGIHGAVSSDHPLASAVGYDVLRRGGNAVDASIAMAAVLAVVRPHMNGVGGDAFAIFYDGETGEVTGLNGSGRSGALATPDFFREAGHDEIPSGGALSVSVPGAVAAWADAHARYGALPFAELLQPAIDYARDGFPVSTRLRADIASQGQNLAEAAQAIYRPGGEPPPVGDLLRNPALAGTLERIAREGKAGFYEGHVAESLAGFLEAEGGYLRAEDFAAHTSTWVEPLRGDYLGRTFLVLPPNTQGLAQLAQMEMAKAFALSEMGHNTSSYLHTLLEVKKLAFADRDRWVADPEMEDLPIDRILDPSYLAERAKQVDPAMAHEEVEPGITGDGDFDPSAEEDGGDTVYLTAVDADGNAVSWIQSLFAGFGSDLLEPETGVMLQNRGALFTLDPDHPNVVEPGKRPYHTLTPTMALHPDGSLAFTLGTPGGDGQTQSILQIVNNLFLFDMTPQEAIEAPRYRGYGGTSVAIEDRVPAAVIAELEALGHDVRIVEGWTSTFGGAQMIHLDPDNGVLTAAAGPRREAYAIAF